MAEKMSIILFSGTMDKLMPVGILASGGVAMGMDVEIFATFWGLQALSKGASQQPPRMSKDYEDMAPMMMQMMQEKNVPSWLDTLKNAKELGNVKVYACSMTMDLMDMKQEDFVDIVDGVVGVGEFVDSAKDAKITLFI